MERVQKTTSETLQLVQVSKLLKTPLLLTCLTNISLNSCLIAIGTATGAVMYVGKNKAKLGAAGAGGAGFVVGAMVGGPVGGIIGGIVAGAVAGQTINVVEKQVEKHRKKGGALHDGKKYYCLILYMLSKVYHYLLLP